MNPIASDFLADVIRQVNNLAIRSYGRRIQGITLHFVYGPTEYLGFPPGPLDAGRDPTPTPRLTEWAAGPDPKHISDFQAVYWPGLGRFRFGPKQAVIVRLLWEARDEGVPEVTQSELLRGANSDCTRLQDLFRTGGVNHPAWGTLIVKGERSATYRLPALLDPDSAEPLDDTLTDEQ